MSNNDYLSKEKQFEEILNNEEISRIKDPELRNIRAKYWHLHHQAFLDEHNIPDHMFGQVADQIREAEKKEIDEYRRRNQI